MEPQDLINKRAHVNFRVLEARVVSNHRKSRQLKVFNKHTQFEAIVPKRKRRQLEREDEKEFKLLRLER